MRFHPALVFAVVLASSCANAAENLPTSSPADIVSAMAHEEVDPNTNEAKHKAFRAAYFSSALKAYEEHMNPYDWQDFDAEDFTGTQDVGGFSVKDVAQTARGDDIEIIVTYANHPYNQKVASFRVGYIMVQGGKGAWKINDFIYYEAHGIGREKSFRKMYAAHTKNADASIAPAIIINPAKSDASAPKNVDQRLLEIDRREAARQKAEAQRQQQIEAKRHAQADARRAMAEAMRGAQQQQLPKVTDTPGIPTAPGFIAPPTHLQGVMGKWACTVRSRVAKLMDVMLAGGREGRYLVSFKVTETGDLTAISVEGEPSLSRRAEAVLQAAGMPASPDKNSHIIEVGVNISSGNAPNSACEPACL